MDEIPKDEGKNAEGQEWKAQSRFSIGLGQYF